MNTVCTINETDLAKVSRMTKSQLLQKIKGMSIHAELQLMREMQIGLAAYARKYRYDMVQEGMLGAIQCVENAARKMFARDRTMSILQSQSWLLTNKDHMQTVKEIVSQEWGVLLRAYRY